MIADLQVHSPKKLTAALQILQQEQGRIKVLAGGTDIMVMIHTRTEIRPAYLNIWGLEELRGITANGSSLRLGALSTYTDLIRSPLVQQHVPLLAQAARVVGAMQIQNRGTLGGNVVNASPAGDTLPVLAVLQAELELVSLSGRRRVPFAQFYTGYRQTVLAPDELLLAVHVPVVAPGDWQYFRKVGTRQAQAISKVVLAVWAQPAGHCGFAAIRIAYGSVAPVVLRTPRTESLLAGAELTGAVIDAARQTVMQEVQPISDVRSTAEYRRTISGNILARSLEEYRQSRATAGA